MKAAIILALISVVSLLGSLIFGSLKLQLIITAMFLITFSAGIVVGAILEVEKCKTK